MKKFIQTILAGLLVSSFSSHSLFSNCTVINSHCTS
jgi:hypothetical protein